MPRTVRRDAPPERPPPLEARVLARVLSVAYIRGLPRGDGDAPPAEWAPHVVRIPRRAGGSLAATWFKAPRARGVVVMGHPGLGAGRAFFHRSDRIPLALAAGLSVLTFDHGGFGDSDAARTLFDEEWHDVFAHAAGRQAGPLHLWGVSMGGYFAHLALPHARVPVASAIFEQVTPHLFHYARRPWLLAAERLGGVVAPRAMAWISAEAHAPHLHVPRILYVSGLADHGILAHESEGLARAAGPAARHFAVAGAHHLGAWRHGGEPLRAAVRAYLASSGE